MDKKSSYNTDICLSRWMNGHGADPCLLEPTAKKKKKHTWTFHIHKVRVRTLNKTLLLVPPLLLLRGWVQQVFCELYTYFCFFKWDTNKEVSQIRRNMLTIKPKTKTGLISHSYKHILFGTLINNPTLPRNRFFYLIDPWRIDASPPAYITQLRPQASYAFGPSILYYNISVYSVE